MNTTTSAHKRILMLDESSAFTELESLATTSGWPLVGRFPQSYDASVEIQWRTDSGILLAYIEFHSDGARVLSLRGEDAEALDAVAATLADSLTVRDTAALLDALDRDLEPAALVRVWRELGLACAHSHPDQPMSERLPDALAAALRHSSRQVRLRALLFTDALGGRWPELMDLVLARKGADAELAYVIDAFEQSLAESSD